jgi:hypothetical protein
MTPDIFIDDEFKELIPALAPDEYGQLEANILAEGCRDALVLWDDVLIDGHNRYAICQKHGIPFKIVQATAIQGYDDAVLWIVHNQLGRRNITDFVRGELALRAKPIIEARAKAKQIATLKQGDSPVRPISDERAIRTDDAIAAQAGVGRDTLRKIEAIQESAAPEVLTAVRAGTISINAAAQVSRLPTEQQSTIAAAGPNEIKKAAAEVRKAEGKPQKEETPSGNDVLREALVEARETASLLAEELEAYRAVEAGSQFEEIKKLQEHNRILKSQLDDYMTQNQQLKKQIKAMQRQMGGQHG